MNAIKKIALIAALMILTSGCATNSQEVRQRAETTASFEIDRGYQQVYRTLINRARDCLQGGGSLAYGDLYHDTRSGSIGVAHHTMGGAAVYITIDVQALSDNRSVVKTYLHYTGNDHLPSTVEKWAHEKSTECGRPSGLA